MKKHISYAGKKVFIGLDVHREFFVASAVSEGRLVKQCRMLPEAEAVESLISKYFAGAEVQTCYEAGFSGFWLHRRLAAAGISNIVVHPAHVEVESNRIKTDKRDSLKLAQQLYGARLRGIRVPSIEEEERRLLTRTREQLLRARRRAQVQIRMRLHQFGLVPRVFSRVMRLKDVERFLDGSQSAALKHSIGYLLSQWVQVEAQIRELNRQLVAQARTDPLDVLYRSVPGIGWLIARVLSNELGDMSQFSNERALFSYTGLTPGEHSSGDKVCRGHISRQGSSRLRHMLVQAAWKAVRKDKELRKFCERIALRRGKKRAIVAVARKLVGKIRAAIQAGKGYELNYKKAA